MVSLRLPGPLLEWATEYAKERGVSRTDLLASALESFQADCKAGVPELRRSAAEQSSVRSDPGVGVGDCPERAEGLGHVWTSSKENSTRPCRYCGTLGRARRNAAGEIVEPGFSDRATEERTLLFARLGQAAMARKAAEGKS